MFSSDAPDDSRAPVAAATRCCGLLTRKVAWRLNWRGWLLVLVVVIIAGLGAVMGVHPFLAVNASLGADLLVIEAWVPDYALKDGVELADARDCRYLVLTGGVVSGDPNPEPGDTYPRIAVKRIRRFGGNLERIKVVESVQPTRDRTYASAVALREWMKQDGIDVTKIDVLTKGTHARRSRLLFQEALGPGVKVGIISVPDREYDAKHWWRYSEGVKEVLSEGAAYLYARFLFRP